MKWSSFKYLVKQGWHSMVANRLMTLASIGVLVACLMITGVAALLSVNVTSYVDYLETLNEIVFFIDDAAPAETVEALTTQIPADGNVAACEYVPKAAAVEEMREYLGDYGDIMNDYAGEGNTENPLPASFRVSVTDVADLAPTVERIKAMGAYTATAEDGTASDANVFYKVNSPSELSSTLVNLKRIVNYIGWGLVAVLGVVSVVVISNTIRLTVFARRKEINIMKFVGATNAFIRLPFFVEGMTVGAISSFLMASRLSNSSFRFAVAWSYFFFAAITSASAFSIFSSNASLLVFLVLAIFIFLPYSASFSSLLSSDAKYFILFASSPKAFNITFWFAVTA